MTEYFKKNINIPKGGAEMKDLVAKMKEKIENEGVSSFSLFSVKGVNEDNRAVFDTIWKEVWEKHEFHDGDIERTEKHYKEYEENSTDILAYVDLGDPDQRIPIGTMRVVWGPNLPVFHDFEIENSWKEKRCVEFTLLTLLSSWREEAKKIGLQHVPSSILWREGYRYAQKGGIETIIMVIEKKIFKMLQDMKLIIHEISREKYYEGGMCTAYAINMKETMENLKKVNPTLYEFFRV